MILEKQQSDLIIQGDVTNHEVVIDKDNMDYIMTLLSSNLYSRPEQSFIREIVSNAWDSHVEACTTDKPVIVRFTPSTTNQMYGSITIRDYGTGLSPERFKNIFCSIGSSTKRESNDYIGSFGIGRFSSLACKNTVSLVSYYEGKKYFYVMSNDNGKISVNELFTLDTDEHNGLEITLDDVDLSLFIYGLRQIMFVPNVYIDSNLATVFTDLKIKKHKYYYTSSHQSSINVVLGHISYMITRNEVHDISKDLTKEERDFLSYLLEKNPVYLKFDIGELSVTPNRENILWNNKSKENFVKRLKEACIEFNENIDKLTSNDIYLDNMFDASRSMLQSLYYNPFEDKIESSYNIGFYRVDNDKQLKINVFYKKNDLLHKISYEDAKFIEYMEYYSMEALSMYSRKTNKYAKLRNIKYILRNNTTISGLRKEYLLSTLTNINKPIKDILITEYDYNRMKHMVIGGFNENDLDVSRKSLLFDLVLSTNDVEFIDLVDNPDYDEWVKARRKARKENKYSSKDYITVHNFRLHDGMLKTTRELFSCDKFIENLKKYHHPIYVAKDRNDKHVKLALKLGIHCIFVNKESSKFIKSLNDKRFIDESHIINSKRASIIKTIYEINPSRIYKILENRALFDKCGTYEINKLIDNILQYNRIFSGLKDKIYYSDFNNLDIKYNQDVHNDIMKAYDFVEKFNKFTYDITDGNYVPNEILMYCVMKGKLFRISMDWYNKIKSNKLLNILNRCGKQ